MDLAAELEAFVVDELALGHGRRSVGRDEDLLAAGIVDSLGVTQLVTYLEDRFGIRVTDEELTPANFRSVAGHRGLHRLQTAMLTRYLYANAGYRPDGEALVHGDRRISHAELLERVERAAEGLRQRGISSGDAVALVLPNGPAFVTGFLAITALGAVVVPLNRQFKVDELAFCLRACGAREVIADEAEIERLVADHPRRPIDPRLPDETFAYQFSSGSTGRPKRLARTHGMLWAEAESYTWITPEDRLFCAIPLFHTYGMGCCLIAAIRNSATLVFLDDQNPFVLARRRALELLEHERISVFPGVPFHFRHLADAPGDGNLGTLRLCFSAGTALPREAFDAFAAALRRARAAALWLHRGGHPDGQPRPRPGGDVLVGRHAERRRARTRRRRRGRGVEPRDDPRVRG